MIALRRKNDSLRTAASIPAWALRVGFIGFVTGVALLLVPVIGWQVAVVAAAVLGTILPHSFGGWFSIAGITVGMLMSEPSLWRASVIVLGVHVIHVVSALLLTMRWNSRVVLAALRPTLRRLLLVQLVAQPLTLFTMLAFTAESITVFGATIVGAGALAVFAILFLRWARSGSRRS